MRTLVTALLLLSSPVLAGYPSGTEGFGWTGFAQIGTHSSVQAKWREPHCSYGPGGGPGTFYPAVAMWVGIGGVMINNLIQIGTECDMNNVGLSYHTGIYEALPASKVSLDMGLYPIADGDLMQANVTCATNCTPNAAGQTWNMSLQNLTQGWTYTNNGFAYVAAMGSAEVIAEAELVAPMKHVYQRFQDVSFQNILIDGANPNLQVSQEYYTTGYLNETGNPSDPNATGDGFKVCYGTGGAYTTCPNTPAFVNDKGRAGAGF